MNDLNIVLAVLYVVGIILHPLVVFAAKSEELDWGNYFSQWLLFAVFYGLFVWLISSKTDIVVDLVKKAGTWISSQF